MTKGKIILLSGVLSFVLLLCPGFVRAFSLLYDFWISYLCYFLAVFFLARKYPEYKKTILVSFVAVILLIFALLSSGGLLWATPNFISMLVACICGYFLGAGSSFTKYIIITFSVLFCGSYFFWGFDFYSNYYYYGSPTGKTNQIVTHNWYSYVHPDSAFSQSNINEKTVLLDFYNTGCAVCLRKFPDLETLYNKYKNNPNVTIYAVDIPWRNDSIGQALHMVRSRNYTFPVLIGKKNLDSIFQIACYPTVVLLKNNRIFYKGEIEGAVHFLEKK